MIQVEVATHFNEDAFSYGLVHGLAQRIREAVGDAECATHTEGSAVRLSTQGVAQTTNDITIEVTGCCEAVTRRVREIVDEVRAREAAS